MTVVNLDYFNLDEMILEFGNTIGLTGAIFSDQERTILLMLPDQECKHITIPELSLQDWKMILRQTDLIESKVLARDEHGLKKAILRKTARQIDARISWNVFRRDNYTCRYCGRNDVPLTVDHVVLWEDGGPSIEENLISACKKCNKTRGNMQYEEWLESEYYREKVQNVIAEFQELNTKLIDTLSSIPRKAHVISRGGKKKKNRVRKDSPTNMDIERAR